MKPTFLLYLNFVFFSSLFAQKEYFEKLSETSNYELSVAPWGEVFFVGYEQPLLKLDQQNNELIHFFFDSKIIAAEKIIFISEKEWMVFNWVSECYKTKNAGATWSKVKFPSKIKHHYFVTSNEKTIWIFSELQELYFSKNMGETWIKHPNFNLEDESEYPLSVRFKKNNKNGLLLTGETFNLYEIKKGNRKLLRKIPFLENPEEENSAFLKTFEIINPYYIIHRADSVYYTEQKNIFWKKLDDAIFLKKSTHNNTILTINSDYSLSIYNSNLEKKWTFNDPWLDSLSIISLDFYKDTIYILDYENLYKFYPYGYQKLDLYLQNTAITIYDKANIVPYQGKKFAYKDFDLFQEDSIENLWKRVNTFPFKIGHMNVYDGKLILKTNNFLYELNPNDFSFSPYLFPENPIYSNKVIEISVQKSISTEFRYYYTTTELIKNSSFLDDDIKSSILNKIILLLNQHQNTHYNRSDFSFTNQEFEKYWTESNLNIAQNDNILKNRFKNFLNNLSETDIINTFNYICRSYEKSNYLKDQKSLIFTFEENIHIEITNATPFYNCDTYLQHPWVFRINGFLFKIYSNELPILLSALFDNQLFDEYYMNKSLLFHNFLNYFIAIQEE